MRNKVIGGIFLNLGLLVSLTPRFILPVCEYYGKNRMSCSYTGWAEMFLGAIVAFAAVGLLLSKGEGALRAVSVACLGAGLSVIILPEALGYCPSPQMPCHYGTVPMERLLGAVVVITSTIGFILSFRAKRPAIV